MVATRNEVEIAAEGRNIIKLLSNHEIVRLDLGGGKNSVKDYINVDICDFEGVDVVADIRKLDEVFPAKSADALMCRDVLSCFKPTEVKGVLRRWAKVLKPRSRFVLQVMDAKQLMEAYVEGRVIAPWTVDANGSSPKNAKKDTKEGVISYDKWKTYMYGPCRDEWTTFHNCFDEAYLKYLVEAVGFEVTHVDYPPLRIRFTMKRQQGGHKAE